MAALSSVIRTEVEKRRARMQKAVEKGYFRLLNRLTVRGDAGPLTFYEVWSC